MLPAVYDMDHVFIVNRKLYYTEFSKFYKVILTQNMRAHRHKLEFVQFLKTLGNAKMHKFTQFGNFNCYA